MICKVLNDHKGSVAPWRSSPYDHLISDKSLLYLMMAFFYRYELKRGKKELHAASERGHDGVAAFILTQKFLDVNAVDQGQDSMLSESTHSVVI